jgi:hypothetical protein
MEPEYFATGQAQNFIPLSLRKSSRSGPERYA